MYEQSHNGKRLRILPLESKCVTPILIEEGKKLCVWESTENLWKYPVFSDTNQQCKFQLCLGATFLFFL